MNLYQFLNILSVFLMFTFIFLVGEKSLRDSTNLKSMRDHFFNMMILIMLICLCHYLPLLVSHKKLVSLPNQVKFQVGVMIIINILPFILQTSNKYLKKGIYLVLLAALAYTI